MRIETSLIPYAAPPFFSSLIVLFLGLFAFYKNPYSSTNKYFALFALACMVWQMGFSLMNLMAYESDAFIFSKILYTGVVLIPVFYYGFIINFLELKSRHRILKYFYIVSLIFILFLWFSRMLLSGNIHYPWGYSSRANWLHGIYLIFFFGVFTTSFIELYQAYKKHKEQNTDFANKIKYVFFTFAIALCGSTDYLSTYGVDYYPLGFIFMILFSVITFYAIIKHRLMDINLAIKKGFLYSAIFSLISFVLIFLILAANALSKIYFGHSSIFFTYLVTLIISIVFIPLHNFLMKSLNQIFFKASPVELAEQNMKLMETVQKADQMKAVATLAAGMAHEIKNPLTSIKTFAEYLPQKYDDPGFREKFSRIVVDEVDRVNNIVKQLLEFSKPKELELKPESITDILDDTLNLLNSNLLKNKIEVVKNYKYTPTISVDKNQLKQAFLNIFINSIQAMPNGGMLSVGTSLLSTDSCLLITISDTGSGIPKDQLEHIFDPFFSTKEDGTGLGLSIVHGIITKHGGEIEVGSEINKHTIFKISFLKT